MRRAGEGVWASRAALRNRRRSERRLSPFAALATTSRSSSDQELISFLTLVFVCNQPPRCLTTPGPSLVRIGGIAVLWRDGSSLQWMRFAIASTPCRSTATTSVSPGCDWSSSRRWRFQVGKQIDLALQLLPFSLDLAGERGLDFLAKLEEPCHCHVAQLQSRSSWHVLSRCKFRRFDYRAA